ncbi:hypothetical protein Syun_019215 [Stephania yunnanensis]|uniref:Uncharacterized protein n=1 Tax=Stephania yunnanensis TaxID=152371 RepID=A0AAP0NWG8_9MAGN
MLMVQATRMVWKAKVALNVTHARVNEKSESIIQESTHDLDREFKSNEVVVETVGDGLGLQRLQSAAAGGGRADGLVAARNRSDDRDLGFGREISMKERELGNVGPKAVREGENVLDEQSAVSGVVSTEGPETRERWLRVRSSWISVMVSLLSLLSSYASCSSGFESKSPSNPFRATFLFPISVSLCERGVSYSPNRASTISTGDSPFSGDDESRGDILLGGP